MYYKENINDINKKIFTLVSGWYNISTNMKTGSYSLMCTAINSGGARVVSDVMEDALMLSVAE